MSDNGPKIAKLVQFKDIEDGILGGIAPLYLFILEQMRTDHFEQLNTLYNALLLHTNKLLKEVYALFPQFEELTDEEKIQLTEAISEKIEEDK
jgi:hypothetical protein